MATTETKILEDFRKIQLFLNIEIVSAKDYFSADE